MATQPSGPPSHSSTSFSWADVNQFATDIGDILAELKSIEPTVNDPGNFTVMPGQFEDANNLATNVSNLGTSVQNATTWMDKLLTQVQSNLTAAYQSFGKTESLNTETGTDLINDLTGTNSELTAGPSGTGTSSSTPPPSS
jgi:hypothetical protein